MYEVSVITADLPGIEVQVNDYQWPPRYEGIVAEEGHVVSLSVSPLPKHSRGCFGLAGGENVELGPVVFLPSNISLRAWNDGGPQRIVRAHFSESKFEQLTGRSGCWSAEQLARITQQGNGSLQAALRRMAGEVLNPGLASRTLLAALAELIAVDILRSMEPGPESVALGGLTPRQIRQLEERIVDPSGKPPCVSELAGVVGISSRHLLRGFRVAFGCTLRERLHQARQARAEELLARSDMRLKQVAAVLGYSSPSSFSTAFLQMTGETPAAFRRRRVK